MREEVEEMPAIQDPLINSTCEGPAPRPYLVNAKAQNTQLHRDVVYSAHLSSVD